MVTAVSRSKKRPSQNQPRVGASQRYGYQAARACARKASHWLSSPWRQFQCGRTCSSMALARAHLFDHGGPLLSGDPPKYTRRHCSYTFQIELPELTWASVLASIRVLPKNKHERRKAPFLKEIGGLAGCLDPGFLSCRRIGSNTSPQLGKDLLQFLVLLRLRRC